MKPAAYAHVPFDGDGRLRAVLSVVWRDGRTCDARGHAPMVLTHTEIEVSVNGSPWKSWDGEACREDALVNRGGERDAAAGETTEVRTSLCGLELTHLEAGPILLHAELVDEGEAGGAEAGPAHQGSGAPTLIFADAAEYHAKLLARNPWLPRPLPSSPLGTFPTSRLDSPPDLSSARAAGATSPQDRQPASLLRNVALGKKAWQVLQ